ncbi:putative RadC-like JAB domain-containing protein [Candidatus Cyrtobacter comes]|uniref:RadC-like JAB domain-containing protein n=1 Tax=Candidatus Cyrtobacter comes TaxID=675776 RepID=A0ABU5L928_9RICK|nr:DNA repair protein RadC [Candidatus Cyrtobacter comes]MDZ5762627.1 putative RadC-like JAB domain-containing protein [Candidatus Cyrtobacter comes]
MPSDQENFLGHRKRLKERFLRSPLRTFADYEVLELFLFDAIPRKDTKILAKTLLQKFSSLQGVFSADIHDLKSVTGVGDSVIIRLKMMMDIFSRFHLNINEKEWHVLSNWSSVISYCNLTMGFKRKEFFRILFLDKRNFLLADELLDSGTIDKVSVYPREIVKHAIAHNASAIILVHNHPSGDCLPSEQDIVLTRSIEHALSGVHIVVHDHIIVAKNSHYSFKATGLL